MAEVMQTSAKSTLSTAARSPSSAMNTSGAASSDEPIRFCARSISSAPVTTRRTVRIAFHLAANASSRQPAGVSGKSCRWTEPSSDGKRDSQVSSAVKLRMGASQMTRRVKAASTAVSALLRVTLDSGSQ